ncbi:MAG: hypothetical protein J2P20_14075, partial [Pseudonocardia sp.]|nr:hypothetical protein [Pseudonocardia sp.]
MSGHTGQRSAPEPGDPTPAEPSSPSAVPVSRLHGSVTSAVPTQRTTDTVIADRYRLLAQVGSDESVHAAFWRARDTVLARDVALTLLQSTGEDGEADRANEMISKALRSGKFEHSGCARLLDVMPRDHNGLPEDVLA